MSLLEANVSSSSILDKKNNDKDGVDLDKDVKIVADSALSPASSPASKSGDVTDSGDSASDQVSVYVIRKGDSIAQIAEMFGVSANTILWANDLKKGDKLVEGDTLIILPVSGVSITVAKGQTLKSLAKQYNVDTSAIAGFNGIPENAKLTVGDELIIPDGEVADGGSEVTPPKGGGYVKTPIVYAPGYFINPVPGFKYRSQGLHAHKRAIDLAADKGTPILAAASGTVVFSRVGYNGGFGNLIIIDHPNGTETYYAHQSKLAVHTGDEVTQGQLIGYVGSTGHSTGPHLHFEVRGAKNPGGDTPMSWAAQ